MSSLFAASTPVSRVAPLVGLRALAAGILATVRAMRNRRHVRLLLELDERALRDIGLMRDDVLGALAVPMASDPSIVLRLRSVERRARRRAHLEVARDVRRREPCL